MMSKKPTTYTWHHYAGEFIVRTQVANQINLSVPCIIGQNREAAWLRSIFPFLRRNVGSLSGFRNRLWEHCYILVKAVMQRCYDLGPCWFEAQVRSRQMSFQVVRATTSPLRVLIVNNKVLIFRGKRTQANCGEIIDPRDCFDGDTTANRKLHATALLPSRMKCIGTWWVQLRWLVAPSIRS